MKNNPDSPSTPSSVELPPDAPTIITHRSVEMPETPPDAPTILTHRTGAMPSAVATMPDDVTIAVDTKGRTLPAATAHSMSSMGSPSTAKSKSSMAFITGEDGWIGDRYRLLDKLGEGGFGLVYRAEQVKPIQRLVAIKILKSGIDSEVVFGRFAAERQTLALMEHPNIARVIDAGETDVGLPYFVMELVKGRSITSYCRQNELDVRHRLELFIPVCQAVHHAHQKSIIHRDLKPANILVADENGSIIPKVIDFGIAKVLEGRDASLADFTGVDQLVGTPGYISPEQIEHGSSHVDTRSDVYALGAILFELLTGKALVTSADVASKPIHVLLRELAERDAPRPSTYEPSVPADLDWITIKALERDPARRYGSADDLAEDISRYLTYQPIKAHPPSRTYLISRFVRRHRIGVAASAAIALAVLGGGITSTALYFEAEENRIKAEQNEEKARQSDSQGDQQMARQFAERGQFQDATAYLARSLRTEPRNELASTNLLSLLANVHLIRPMTGRLDLPEHAQEARLTAISRSAGMALAVSSIMSEKLQAPLPPIRLHTHDVISIWDMQKGKRLDSPLPEGIFVTCLEVTRDGQQAVIAKDDGTMELWNLKDGKRRMLQPQLPFAVLSIAFSGDGHTLIAGSEAVAAQNGQGFCHVWDLREPQKPARTFAHPKAILCVDIDRTGELAVVASPEGVAQVWDLAALKPVGDVIEVDEGLANIALNRKRQIVAIGMNNGTVFIGSYVSDQEPIALTHPTSVRSLHLSEDGNTLNVGDAGGFMHCWNLTNYQPRHPPQQLEGEIIRTAVSGSSGLVATVSKIGEVLVWNPQTNERHTQRLKHPVSAVNFTDDGTMLMLAPRNQAFVQGWSIHENMTARRFIDAPEKELIIRPDPPANSPIFVRTSKAASWNRSTTHIIAADDDGLVAVFDGKTVAQVGVDFRHPPAVGAAALTSDASIAVTSGRDQVVRVWDVKTGASIAALRHSSFVMTIALSPDDQRVVTFTENGEMRVWNIRSGDCLTPAIRFGGDILQARVADDGATVLFRLAKLGWFTLPMPPAYTQLPEWFLHLSDTIAGRRQTADRRSEDLTLADFQAASAAVPSGADTTAARYAHWLLADPTNRPLSPVEDEPLADYLKSLEKNGSPFAKQELLRFQPAAK